MDGIGRASVVGQLIADGAALGARAGGVQQMMKVLVAMNGSQVLGDDLATYAVVVGRGVDSLSDRLQQSLAVVDVYDVRGGVAVVDTGQLAG